MLKVVIIEDEIPARKKLRRFIEDLATPIEIVAELDTVASAIAFLSTTNVDLIFSDIELLDGNAFDIYTQVKVEAPIIFTTAYNNFWMNAFESNGIEYLLKPYSRERFLKAWEKFLRLTNADSVQTNLLTKLMNAVNTNQLQKTFKKKLSVNTNQGTYFIAVASISYFRAEEGVIFAVDSSGKQHLIAERTLKDLETQLDPTLFFKINRGELVNKEQVEKIERFNKNTLAIKLKDHSLTLKTSQSQTASFKVWIAD